MLLSSPAQDHQQRQTIGSRNTFHSAHAHNNNLYNQSNGRWLGSRPQESSSSSHSSYSSSASSTSTGPQERTSSAVKYSRQNIQSFQQYRQEQRDSMSITVEEYREVLNAEVWVEVNKLRDYARHGISPEVRGETWLYLLGIMEADRSKEVSQQKQMLDEYEQIDKDPNESAKRVRGETSRYLRKVQIESSRNIPRLFENVISAYTNQNHSVEYYPAMVNICAPFIYSVQRECDAYYCFERIINALDEYSHIRSINESVASFMTLFRTCIPDLYSYFEEEEVDVKEWAASALQHILSRELSLENLMRLWDTYFSIPDWMELHPFFCLAVLKHLKESLEELEQSEIRTLLMRLPRLDMDQIINEAFNLRHEIMERQISDDTF